MHQLEARLIMGLFGVVLVVGGLAFATNFRGYTAWHARKSIDSVKWLERLLNRVPSWNWILERPLEERVARQVGMNRVIGAVFAASGVIVLILSFFARFHAS